MAETNDIKREQSDELKRIVAKATENARTKNARLRQLKERHELYLVARRGEELDEADEDVTEELRLNPGR